MHSTGRFPHPHLKTTPVPHNPALARFRQTERLAGSAASLVNSAVSGLAWAGSKVAGGGEQGRRSSVQSAFQLFASCECAVV